MLSLQVLQDLDALASNNSVSRPLVSDADQSVPEASVSRADMGDGAGDGQDSGEIQGPRTHVCPYSARNLMSADVYDDNEYRIFVKIWTRAETMVLRPVRLAVTVEIQAQ